MPRSRPQRVLDARFPGAATKAWDFILAGTPEAAPGYEVTRHWWAFYIDIEKCIGCGNCVRATSAGVTVATERRIYTRVLADADGKTIEKEYVAFLKAAKILSDTRLAPDETRLETFSFKVPAGQSARIDAIFYYFHPATADPEKSDRIKFLDLTKNLP